MVFKSAFSGSMLSPNSSFASRPTRKAAPVNGASTLSPEQSALLFPDGHGGKAASFQPDIRQRFSVFAASFHLLFRIANFSCFWCSICKSPEKQNKGNTATVLPLILWGIWGALQIPAVKRHRLPVPPAETGTRYTKQQKWQPKYKQFGSKHWLHRRTAKQPSQIQKCQPDPS